MWSPDCGVLEVSSVLLLTKSHGTMGYEYEAHCAVSGNRLVTVALWCVDYIERSQ